MKKLLIIFSVTFCLLGITIPLYAEVKDSEEKLLSEQQKKESSDLVYNVQKIVLTLKEGKIGKVSDIFVSLTTLLIAIGAVCSISYKTIKAALKGEIINLESLLAPFVFAILISVYQPLTSGVDWTINVFDGLVIELGDSSLQQINEKREEKWNILKEIMEKKDEYVFEQGIEAEGGFFQPLLDALAAIMESLNQAKNWLIHQTLVLFSFCAVFLTRLLGATLSIIFYVIGPICIALSAIPAFSDSWKNWLSKYIWVQLFAPICRLISWILQEVELAVLNSDISRLKYVLDHFEETGGGLGSPGEGFMEGTAYLGFMIVGAILYLAVPSIASWIVNTSGGGIMTAMNTAGAYLGTKAMKGGKQGMAGGYNGGKSAVARGVNSVKNIFKK